MLGQSLPIIASQKSRFVKTAPTPFSKAMDMRTAGQRILSVGPDADVLASHNRRLTEAGHVVRGVTRRSDVLQAARFMTFDLVLLCDSFPPGYADELVRELVRAKPGLRVVRWSAELDTQTLVGGVELTGLEQKAA